jgi:hypothetical protein
MSSKDLSMFSTMRRLVWPNLVAVRTREPSLGVDDDLDGALVVVDECVETFIDELVQRDSRGNERRKLDLAVPSTQE